MFALRPGSPVEVQAMTGQLALRDFAPAIGSIGALHSGG